MNKTILLVDDDPFQLRIYEKLLQNNGYSCKVALSVDAAEEILNNNEVPDLIISDYEMPDKNGFEFRKRLLQHDLLKKFECLGKKRTNPADCDTKKNLTCYVPEKTIHSCPAKLVSRFYDSIPTF